ncbi:MAG TPA: hypothetical protein VFO16_24200 [Pseudonocardiaceae bacterium]|nr:hypothetical protein [Pseudonocardiaceae bacterium]
MPLPGSSIDAPPPSPALDPQAAQEAGPQGNPPLPADQLAQPLGPQGPDISGLNAFTNKIVEACLAVAAGFPSMGPTMQQAVAVIQNGLAQFGAQASSIPGIQGQSVTQAGPQFPGAVAAGKPF